MILEGRFRQGWDCLKVEVSRANSSLRVVRETRECKKVTVRRSYAEVAGLSKNQAIDCFILV
jgi:hypothetical protein